MKHRMQQSLNDLEMHGKNSLFVGGRDGIGLTNAEAPAGPEDLSEKKARTGEIKGYSRPPPRSSPPASQPALWAWRRVLSDWSDMDTWAASLCGDSRAHRAPGPRAAAQGFQQPMCKRRDRHLTHRRTT